MGAVEQMVRAFSAGNLLSAFMGMVLGGFVPIAVYALVQYEVAEHPWYWPVAAGGLIHSAISVFKWAEQAFHMWVKAMGFVLLLKERCPFPKSIGSVSQGWSLWSSSTASAQPSHFRRRDNDRETGRRVSYITA